MDAEKNQGKIRLCYWGYAEGNPSIRIKMHVHDFFQANFTLSGKCELITENGSCPVQENDLLFVAPGTLHTLKYSEKYLSLCYKFYMEQPVFPEYSVNITDFGAVADGKTLNTEAINNAIKDVNSKGGGKVVIPAGLWLTGPIELKSNVNLYTEQNSLILFTDDFNAYPILETSFEGLETRRCQSPISAWNAENIAITGYGVFDGSGDSWRPVKKGKMTASQWKSLLASGGVVENDVWYPTAGSLKGAKACKEFNNPEGIETDEEWNEIRPWLRPVLLNIVKSKKVLLEGVTFKNSPSWCLHPLSCEHITIKDVKVFNPWYSQNGDALDLDHDHRACDRLSGAA